MDRVGGAAMGWRWAVRIRPRAARQRGQVLVLFGFVMLALLGMTGLAVDLGLMLSYNRQTENAADAGALAGAEALARHLTWRLVCSGATALPANSGCIPTDPFPNGPAVMRDIECTMAAAIENTDLGSIP